MQVTRTDGRLVVTGARSWGSMPGAEPGWLLKRRGSRRPRRGRGGPLRAFAGLASGAAGSTAAGSASPGTSTGAADGVPSAGVTSTGAAAPPGLPSTLTSQRYARRRGPVNGGAIEWPLMAISRLPGGEALSGFRLEKLNAALAGASHGQRVVATQHWHFVETERAASEADRAVL